MADLKDSGERRETPSGSVRDRATGKGRCDLLPLLEIADFLEEQSDGVIRSIHKFIRTGEEESLLAAMDRFYGDTYSDPYTALLELAIQYEDGAKKYSERNWEKGQPLSWYIDSGTRHYLKFLRGDKDEPHDRAFGWNIFGAIWTLRNLPELNDLPFAKNAVEEPPAKHLEVRSCENCGWAKLGPWVEHPWYCYEPKSLDTNSGYLNVMESHICPEWRVRRDLDSEE